ncbi:23S rRNA (pseudouridine(1915)-N(3))-methyltransferase RlmH [Notoacmeibacter sp. MSK16QG-6]|uniref:23S rRNA (pseudouridine(1915)-N(3))-methyltransferase RlmH n=1 Tax=Notoacmeibacter sp. MSK16QG-6 TaxID=2957982 RepID=UPI00209D272F|nr:23S rRNA (pseudouridine(1915)-N(3))-methyltransferase RlmH [Notoacmeibacter sp. MSK16QG-6]MCP1200955.1 23S rRNA (pseudouridine(1915)-N(3))-methyltransferase RlmH [Notoacmeibacter sp. MSK16QG-6]
MRIVIHAIGRMKAGPEAQLCDRYIDRFQRAGGQLGLQFGGIVEPAESRASSAAQRKREEADRLGAHLGNGAALILLDEAGRNLPSIEFAETLARYRDAGRGDLVIAIGGPDGHDTALRDKANLVISYGKATFPHQIVRILLAEQLYRAATILSGHPYHRS